MISYMSSDPNPCYLLYIGDEVLPSYIRHIISHETRIPIKQPVQWNVIGVLGVAHMKRSWIMKSNPYYSIRKLYTHLPEEGGHHDSPISKWGVFNWGDVLHIFIN